ncbi:hypothetical protein D7030_12945 [Flavobacteriaceae bacterium AU392]|nr:hypothetical protein D1817_05545 [Flavobacteriaceae bacterium]RKM81212.1 hypothetical protein D7030_12945 [Flavobacteriaceae bacterium AU392]
MNDGPFYLQPQHETAYTMPHEDPRKFFDLRITIPVKSKEDPYKASVKMHKNLNNRITIITFELEYKEGSEKDMFKFFNFIMKDIPIENLELIQVKVKNVGEPNSEGNCELENYPLFDDKTPRFKYNSDGKLRSIPCRGKEVLEKQKQEQTVESGDSCTIPPGGGN